MSSDILLSLILIASPFTAAVLWAQFTASPRLAFWLRRSVFWGAPLFVLLIIAMRTLIATCTHVADFGFTSCTALPVSLANAMMTGFVFILIMATFYGLALFGVGAAVEFQTRFARRR